jgi:ribose transport system ATP-binding protein
MRREVERLLREFDIRPRNPDAKMHELSGGNQQKVLLAKWLLTEPRLLVLQEPTHGVDVGARRQIVELVRRAAREGIAVVCASTDSQQLCDLCDRVLVFAGGRIVTELVGDDVQKEKINKEHYRVTRKRG